MIRFADGSKRDSSAATNRTVAAVREQALADAAETRRFSLGVYAIDPELSSLFERNVDDLLAHGVTPVFFLPPSHPVTYRAITANPNYRIITNIEGYCRRVAASRGIPVICSYDPERCHLGEADFFDGMHRRRESTAKIFARTSF